MKNILIMVSFVLGLSCFCMQDNVQEDYSQCSSGVSYFAVFKDYVEKNFPDLHLRLSEVVYYSNLALRGYSIGEVNSNNPLAHLSFKEQEEILAILFFLEREEINERASLIFDSEEVRDEKMKIFIQNRACVERGVSYKILDQIKKLCTNISQNVN